MGIRQLKMHDGCPVTAGRAVMVYSAAEALKVDDVAMDMTLLVIEDVDDWPMARAIRDEKMRRNFIAMDK